ncbi:hypothetical protein BARBAKC583_0881 [Bartonella bacilliformis KC583]|uniref:Uncharacterized protein n=1 Tax=Bartonella bacilliformis (strain ATCC 35685 / KC583 / Herrer 020/F12,63) TaxID=360095 RepID=A1UT64_BARBK|nr:hypothetical protein BARBAKC583_0881 [Bartonella bacilliformis KC583]
MLDILLLWLRITIKTLVDKIFYDGSIFVEDQGGTIFLHLIN